MKDKRFTRLEAQFEKLIEGAFAQIFSKTIRPHDIAMNIARAMEDNIEPARDGDPRPFAPDHYTIEMNDDVCAHLLVHQPNLLELLSGHVIELAELAHYRLRQHPVVTTLPRPNFGAAEIRVVSSHMRHGEPTSPMSPINMPHVVRTARAQVVINGAQVVNLSEPVVNLGRGRDNHIEINDPHVSRHHAQLRLRFGSYTVFDTRSQGGTFVNEVRVTEHRLQSGDVIRIGKTQLLYLEDRPNEPGTQTSVLPKVEL